MEEMKHCFQNDNPQVFNQHNERKTREKFDQFIEITKGEVEQWNGARSDWFVEKIELSYVKIARYDTRTPSCYTNSSSMMRVIFFI